MGTRKLAEGKYQGVVGWGRPGQTKAGFPTRAAARAWAVAAARKRGPVRLRRKYPEDDWMPVGVNYSKGKWYARSPRSHPKTIVRVFADSAHGDQAPVLALAVARAWLGRRRA